LSTGCNKQTPQRKWSCQAGSIETSVAESKAETGHLQTLIAIRLKFLRPWTSMNFESFGLHVADVLPHANPLLIDANAIARNIKYHVDFMPSFSPYKFKLPQAYVATAESLHDTLMQRWYDTFQHFTKENAKTIHYLSTEFL